MPIFIYFPAFIPCEANEITKRKGVTKTKKLMSTQKGNANRSRSQKHKNCTKFENDKYDSSKKTKTLNNMKFQFLCKRCEDIIQWKIQYKKYKSLTVPAKCIKCQQKTIKAAYHNICNDCAEKLKVCAKCGGDYDSELMNEDDEKVS